MVKKKKVKESILNEFNSVSEVVSSIRNFRKQKQIPNKEKISLFVKENDKVCRNMDSIICKLGNLNSIEYINRKKVVTYSFIVGSNEYFIPLSESIDIEEELEKLKKELDYTEGFLKIVKGKLSNNKICTKCPTTFSRKRKK